ncbi:MAG: hypothetical protein IPL23_11060 [Saprospiraceae bacterium]|nr:hypothetical protein [Saprospiraceae bacterium]
MIEYLDLYTKPVQSQRSKINQIDTITSLQEELGQDKRQLASSTSSGYRVSMIIY